MEIFGNIKGVNEDYLENVVIEMAEEVSLFHIYLEFGTSYVTTFSHLI